MSTGIEWTDETWNPVVGCAKVSPGCDRCYAIREANRHQRTPAYAGTVHRTAAGLDWSGTVRCLPERLDLPLRWHRPRRVFVNSMSDLFHDGVPDEFIVAVFARMWWAPKHTFQVLTKRHARMRSLLPRIEAPLRQRESDLALVDCPTPLVWPLPNVWLGVSVEDQHWADIRIPALLDTPAAVRWISAEPLLGPIDLTRWLTGQLACGCGGEPGGATFGCSSACMQPEPPPLDWVVAGGESGPGARPMHPDWARSLRDQCAAQVPFLFKQWGEFAPFGAAQAMQRVGKKFAGRRLDGRTWDEYPDRLAPQRVEDDDTGPPP